MAALTENQQIFENLTTALRLRAPRKWIDPTSLKEIENLKIKGLIENALAALTATMDPDPVTLQTIINTGSASALRNLLRAHGSEFYRKNNDGINYNLPVETGNVQQLEIIHKEQLNTECSDHTYITYAWKNQCPEYLAFIRNTLKSDALFIDHIPFGELTLECPDVFIDEVADELESYCTQEEGSQLPRPETPHSEIYIGNHRDLVNTHLKTLAIVIASGACMKSVLRGRMPEPGSDRLSDIMHLSKSAHGLIKLKEMEGSMLDLLNRRKNGTFFGITHHQASKMWQDWPDD